MNLLYLWREHRIQLFITQWSEQEGVSQWSTGAVPEYSPFVGILVIRVLQGIFLSPCYTLWHAPVPFIHLAAPALRMHRLSRHHPASHKRRSHAHCHGAFIRQEVSILLTTSPNTKMYTNLDTSYIHSINVLPHQQHIVKLFLGLYVPPFASYQYCHWCTILIHKTRTIIAQLARSVFIPAGVAPIRGVAVAPAGVSSHRDRRRGVA